MKLYSNPHPSSKFYAMKKIFVLHALSILVLSSCDLDQKDSQEANDNPPVDSLNQSATGDSLDGQEGYPSSYSSDDNIISDEKLGVDISVDLCKCLTEPGNSKWLIENEASCRYAISDALGVENWEKVNFSKEPELNRKWDELVERCTGSSEVKTGIEEIDSKSKLIKEIGTSYGYVWESIDYEAQIYATLAFDGLVFRSAVYSMDGYTNSEDFTLVLDLSGEWSAIDDFNIQGVYEYSDVPVYWELREDYASLINGKGIVFKRVKVNSPTETKNSSSNDEDRAQTYKRKEENNIESIDGTYSYMDNSVEIVYSIYGNTWIEKFKIITGVDWYDEQNTSYSRGIVVGNELYHESGLILLGRVEQNRLITTVGGQRVVLEKQ